MDQPLSRRVRLIAVCCHISGLIPFAFFYITSLEPPQSDLDSQTFSSTSPLTPIILLAPFIVWALTKKIHDFVDRSGQKALNYYCSIALYGMFLGLIMVICFILAMFYWIGSNAPPANSTADEFNFFSSISSGIWRFSSSPYLLLFHTLNISIASFFALRGRVFSYPLAIPFFRSPKI
jgi:uncharacterized Tic20 family protein